jgi:hypothetical protein
MDYIINAENSATETVFLHYKNEQRRVRNQAVMLWQEAQKTMTAYAALNDKMTAEFAPVADYHVAVAGELGGAEETLLAKVSDMAAFIEQMQAASLAAGNNLFPGVTVTLPDAEE